MSSYRYWAFISYSSRDRTWGEWLIRALEQYRIPKAFVGRPTEHGPVPRRLFPVFRDRDELRAGGEVGGALHEALLASRYLVVICSPSSADPSSWVGKEIEIFKAAGRSNDILALIVAGQPHASRSAEGASQECFPLPLLRRFDEQGRMTDEPADPLAADVRREDARPRVSRRKALLKLIARMIDVDFDQLEKRDRRQRRRQALLWTAAALVLVAALAATSVLRLQSSRQQLAKQLVTRASALRTDQDHDRSLLLGVLAYQVAPIPEAHRFLIETVRSNPHLVTHLHRGQQVRDVAFSSGDSLLAVASFSTVTFYPLQTLRPRGAPIDLRGEITHLRFQGGRLLVAYRDGDLSRVVAVDPERPAAEPSRIFATSEPITALGTSSDGHLYAVATPEVTKIFDQRLGRLRCWISMPVSVMSFSRDGRYIAAANDGQAVWAHLDEQAASSSCRTHRVRSSAMRSSDVAFDSAAGAMYIALVDGIVIRQRLDAPAESAVWISTPSASPEGYRHWFDGEARSLVSHFRTDLRVEDFGKRRELLEALEEARRNDASVYELDAIERALQDLVVARFAHGAAKRAVVGSTGRFVATLDDGNVYLWTIEPDALVSESETPDEVTGSRTEARSADGRFRVTAAEQSEGCAGDGIDFCRVRTILNLYDARRGERIITIEVPRAVPPVDHIAVEFAPDHRLILRRGMMREVWTLAPEHVLDRARRMANRTLTEEELREHLPAWQRVMHSRHSDSSPR